MNKNEHPEHLAEGKDGTDTDLEDSESVRASRTKRRSRSSPAQTPGPVTVTTSRNKRSPNGGPNVVSELEPGPNDDDGLPESAGRRVPS